MELAITEQCYYSFNLHFKIYRMRAIYLQ